jgi:hypothetical protein
MSNILECSSRGDKRYSAFFAIVNMFGVNDVIERHYQLCKRIGNYAPTTVKGIKGRKPTHIAVNGVTLEVRFLSQYYKYMWYTYLNSHFDLVEYASRFDDFSDMFKGRSVNCQADVIRQYMRQGKESLEKEFRELLWLVENKDTYISIYKSFP